MISVSVIYWVGTIGRRIKNKSRSRTIFGAIYQLSVTAPGGTGIVDKRNDKIDHHSIGQYGKMFLNDGLILNIKYFIEIRKIQPNIRKNVTIDGQQMRYFIAKANFFF